MMLGNVHLLFVAFFLFTLAFDCISNVFRTQCCARSESDETINKAKQKPKDKSGRQASEQRGRARVKHDSIDIFLAASRCSLATN